MRNKKQERIAAVLIGLICTYAGYLIAACTGSDGSITLVTVINRLPEIMNHPAPVYWTEYSIWGIFYGSLVGLYAAVYYYFTRKKWMWGREQGSAEWGDVKEITKRLTPSKKEIREQKERGEEKELIRIISQNLRISMSDVRTDLNNNVLIIAGSGKGKTLRVIVPNILRMLGSMVITDPKKDLLRTYGKYLKKHGYEIRVLDLIDFELSDHYNPFAHVKDNEEITELVDTIWSATEDDKAQKGEAVWEDSAKMLFEALCLYVFMQEEEEKRTFRRIIEIVTDLSLGESTQDKWKKRMEHLLRMDKLHPAASKYVQAMSGAESTVKSVLFSLSARLGRFSNEKLLRILDGDSIDFKAIGMGYPHNPKKKTALFICVSDNNPRWNFMASLLYMQAFKELEYQADHFCADDRGKLPIPVTFYMDEFRNTPMPKNFLNILSTMRSRNMSVVLSLQDISQIQYLYEKEYQSIYANCDVTIYLGGNSPDTHKWISERLGPATIDKRSTGKSYGMHGSDSRNDDTLKRELLMSDEVSRLSKKEQLVFVSGEFPIKDLKYNTLFSREFLEAKVLGHYEHNPVRIDTQRKMEKVTEKKTSVKGIQKEGQTKQKKMIQVQQVAPEHMKAYQEAAPKNVTFHSFYDIPVPFEINRKDEAAKLKDMDIYRKMKEEQIAVIKAAIEAGCSIKTLREVIEPNMTVEQMRAVIQGFLGVPLNQKVV